MDGPDAPHFGFLLWEVDSMLYYVLYPVNIPPETVNFYGFN